MTTTVLPHLDDVGVTHGSVIAWKKLRAAGIARSGSVMVPCPWYPMAVEDFHQDPDQDLGVHITLTSEWSAYRWRPISGPNKYLCDIDGFFYKRPHELERYVAVEAMKDEMCAQIERVISDGIQPTHIDAHMGCIYLDKFIEAALDVTAKLDVPLFVCSNWKPLFDCMSSEVRPSEGRMKEVMQEVKRRGHPVFDDFLITFPEPPMDSPEWYASYLQDLSPGLHWLALHANAPGDLQFFAAHHQWPRERDYDFFSGERVGRFFKDRNIQTVGYSELLRD
ncbi:ChbG/HpnK family deacetylase [Pseudovibrio exalbescens]|uniref:ChbG/HpnK family deacetylase n=1 Tax=Pseudovibrio exalbescens TaxID=197461 RepID=UPI000C99FF3E|nr:ChbG/HpnK family deacetylase [Pseudovibrio exalbescens]